MVVANLKDFTPFPIFQNQESSKSSCHDPLSYGNCIFLPQKKKPSFFQNPSMWSILSFHKRILLVLNSKEKSQWCEQQSQRLSITSTLNLKNSNSDSVHMSCISYKSIFKNLKNQSQCPCICHAS